MRSAFLTIAAAALTATAVHAEPATYAIDPTHTFATFEIGHFGASVNRGRFDKKEGSVQFDKAGRVGKVELTFHINSINTGTAQFDTAAQARKVLEAGGLFYACGSCLKLRGLEGSEICPLSTLSDQYEIVRDSDRLVTI